MRGYRTMQEVVFETLRDRILGGKLRPGQRIRQDSLARQLGVSRMPIREALRRLAEMGLVRFNPHRGAEVVRLDAAAVEDMFVTRAALEGMAARLAARRLDRGALVDLKTLLTTMDRAASRGAFAAYIRLNDRFHERINRACGLETLVAAIEAARDRCALTLRSGLNLPERLAQSQKEHREIFAACHRGDGRAAERAMRDHIVRTAGALVARFGQAPAGAAATALRDLLA